MKTSSTEARFSRSTVTPARYVHTYRSPPAKVNFLQNLVEWTYVGELLSRQSSGDLGPNRVVERPKVLYNEATRKYVMWMHIDDSSYKEAKTGVATSSSVCGKYTYLYVWLFDCASAVHNLTRWLAGRFSLWGSSRAIWVCSRMMTGPRIYSLRM